MAKEKPFEKHTERYEDWFERNEYAYESELQALRKVVPSNKKGIEIGVGSGRFARPLSIEIGLDPSFNMLEIAKERHIQVIRGIGESLPVEKENFDFALVVTTICFFDNTKKAIEEIKRILRKDGEIIIGFVDRESYLGKKYEKKKEKNVFYREARFFTFEEVKRILEDLDFKDITSVQTLFKETDSLSGIDLVKEGHGEGSFIVIKGKK